MIPTKLSNWSYDVLQELVLNGQNESNTHDFKTDFPDSETLTKLCCAFANTNGGFIVLGISEVNHQWKICGIDNNIELAHKFGQKIKANPTISFSLPKIINIPNSIKIIAIFEVSKSYQGPHIPDISQEKRNFLKRTNKGNDYMSYEEIKQSFSNYYEKLEKLKLLQLEIENNIEICNEIVSSSPMDGTSYSLLSFENASFQLLIAETFPLFSDNLELIKNLQLIKKNILILNNELKIFMQKVCLPVTDRNRMIRQHNSIINVNTTFLLPLFSNALVELKKYTEI